MAKISYIVKKIVRGMLLFFGSIVQPIFTEIIRLLYERAVVPPITDPLLEMSASEIASNIRSRNISAVDVMTSFINRAKTVNPLVNAVVANRYSAALAEARRVDKLVAEENPHIMNLKFLGVPLSVKEAFQLEGMPNTSGLYLRQFNIASSTAPVVQYLQVAGAIPFIMTNTSELCMWYESANKIYGRTKNAYNTQHIVGGSSGGEGCILSCGASVIGVGSDIGGSIRMPAFFNGIFGHKPSRGMVDNTGQHPIANGSQMELLTTGPMCRYAEDLLPMLQVMSGNPPELKLDEDVDLRNLRFYTMENDGGSLLQSSVTTELVFAQRRAVEYLETSLGVAVTTVNIRRMKYSLEMWSARMSEPGSTMFSTLMADKNGGSVNGFSELGWWLIGQSKHTLPAIMLAALECFTPLMAGTNAKFLRVLADLKEEMRELLSGGGILLYPSHPCTAQLHNQPLTTPTNFAYTAVFNALGLPVTQCPLGLGNGGLPMGVQIVGGMNEDRNTLAVAKWLAENPGPAGWVSPGTHA